MDYDMQDYADYDYYEDSAALATLYVQYPTYSVGYFFK